MVKYRIEYNDVEGVSHKLDISDANYDGVLIEVQGKVFLDYGGTDDPIEAIRGSAVRVELEASNDRTYYELYTTEERTFSVEYTRDNEVLFNGWVNPEGYYESFVADYWIVSLDCVDGLSYLTEIAYTDENGIQFVDKQSHLEIIANCLKKTEIVANINTNIDIYYTDLSTSLDVLDNVYANTERFIKDDQQTIMSCEDVLRDVLEGYAACITMYKGEWFIYKPNQLYLDSEATFFRYDEDGVALSPTTQTIDFSQVIGSQIKGFDIHHCNGNQSISVAKPIGTYRISYKYGLDKGLTPNPFLKHSGGTINDWTINSSTYLTLNASGLGVDLEFDEVPTSNLNLTSDDMSVSTSATYKFRMEFSVDSASFSVPGLPPDNIYGTFYYDIKTDDGAGGSIYHYDPNNLSGPAWVVGDLNKKVSYDFENPGSSATIEFDLPALHSSAVDLYIEIWTPEGIDNSPTYITNGEILLTKVQIIEDDPTALTVEGETHTFLRNQVNTSRVEDTKEVVTGDNATDQFLGVLYENDETTPTITWFRKGITEAKPLLRIMGEEAMRMNARHMELFSGDVYGYIPYLSVVQVDGRGGLFMPIEFSYDSKNNVTSLVLKRIFGDELTDIFYQMQQDLGNVVRPTIISN